MMELVRISLEAHNSERNHHRRYELTVGRDLLGDWLVCIHFGRSGQRLQSIQFASDSLDNARAICHQRLKRRLSAKRRIGTDYQLTELAAPGLDAVEWLPKGLTQMAILPESQSKRASGLDNSA